VEVVHQIRVDPVAQLMVAQADLAVVEQVVNMLVTVA
jgi:hypothetical protein